MTDPSVVGLDPSGTVYESDEVLEKQLSQASDRRIFAIALALQRKWSVNRIHALTDIDPWFLWKLKRIANIWEVLNDYQPDTLPATTLLQAKKSGFSDKQIASLIGGTEMSVRELRTSQRITPFVKQIDTMAAEFPA